MEQKKIWIKKILVLAIILILGAIPTPLSSYSGVSHIVQAQTVGTDTANTSGQETGMMIFLIGIVIIVLIVVIAAVIVTISGASAAVIVEEEEEE